MNPEEHVNDFLSELNAGVFVQKLDAALRECAQKAMTYGDKSKKAKITIEFSIAPFNDSEEQAMITHKLSKSMPTKRGKRMEDDTTDTMMFVHPKGYLRSDAPPVDANGQGSIMEFRGQ